MSRTEMICEMGELKFGKCDGEYTETSEVVHDILNDILENAMDVAMRTEAKQMSDSDLRTIIDNFSKIRVSSKPPTTLDLEVKRLLNQMMSPPAHDPPPRKDGVGDQPLETSTADSDAEPLCRPKALEKKSRVTDLVMNSKRVLHNLLNEEQRRRQEEWEESNERVIQVIELRNTASSPRPEEVPFPEDDDDDLLRKVEEDALEQVELKGGDGGDCGAAERKHVVQGVVGKKESSKRKRWSFGGLKCLFWKGRHKQIEN